MNVLTKTPCTWRNVGTIVGIQGPMQTRLFKTKKHRDLDTPDFEDVLRDTSANRAASTEKSKLHIYSISGGLWAGSIFAGKGILRALGEYMGPARDIAAAGSIEIKLGDIPEGKSKTFKWRGKPLFVRHRTSAEISKEESQSVGELRDPQTDQDRVQDPKWLVVIGICTHLGCIPISNRGDWGGFYCPCHGSHYDASGRVRKGPAPLNLEVPPYKIKGDMLVVG